MHEVHAKQLKRVNTVIYRILDLVTRIFPDTLPGKTPIETNLRSQLDVKYPRRRQPSKVS